MDELSPEEYLLASESFSVLFPKSMDELSPEEYILASTSLFPTSLDDKRYNNSVPLTASPACCCCHLRDLVVLLIFSLSVSPRMIVSM